MSPMCSRNCGWLSVVFTRHHAYQLNLEGSHYLDSYRVCGAQAHTPRTSTPKATSFSHMYHREIACDRKWKSQQTPATPHAVPRPSSVDALKIHRRHLRPRVAREHAVSNMCGSRRGVNGAPRQCLTDLRVGVCAAQLHHLPSTRSEATSPPPMPPSGDGNPLHFFSRRNSSALRVFTCQLHSAQRVDAQKDGRSCLGTSRPGRRAASAARRRRQSRLAHCRGSKPRPRHHWIRPTARCLGTGD